LANAFQANFFWLIGLAWRRVCVFYRFSEYFAQEVGAAVDHQVLLVEGVGARHDPKHLYDLCGGEQQQTPPPPTHTPYVCARVKPTPIVSAVESRKNMKK
jgi:hypothetical protein